MRKGEWRLPRGDGYTLGKVKELRLYGTYRSRKKFVGGEIPEVLVGWGAEGAGGPAQSKNVRKRGQ